jgi:hypothetical protein
VLYIPEPQFFVESILVIPCVGAVINDFVFRHFTEGTAAEFWLADPELPPPSVLLFTSPALLDATLFFFGFRKISSKHTFIVKPFPKAAPMIANDMTPSIFLKKPTDKPMTSKVPVGLVGIKRVASC